MLIHKQTGITLIELLIGMLVGLVVLAGGINIFITSVKGQNNNINLSRLNQDMRTMMSIIESDIRRAGFATSLPDTYFSSVQTNPFFDSTTSGATTDLAVYNTGSCIVFSYNSDNDPPPTPPIGNSNERFGFRLNSTTGNLELRSSGSTNENCTDGAWQSVTEPTVHFTGLTFTLTTTPLNVHSMVTDTDSDGCYDGDDQAPATASSTCKTGLWGNGLCDTGEGCNTCVTGQACSYVRDVTILLTGVSRKDSTVTQTITEQVRVRNDKFLLSAP
ncbi:MAG TPA: prepilin-type N-terminal cleavage/methylation domain-containing protein [Methylobacter sp.]|jgi:type IV pilus assembly protein PilW